MIHMNKLLTATLLLLLSLQVQARESCALADIGLTPGSPVPQQLYYAGTCHYRNGDHAKAVQQWIRLANLTHVDTRFIPLQVNVLNNLGYMLFFGLGIKEDQRKAVTYWEKAVAFGQGESEYHLCHAYADKSTLTYNPAKALQHCQKAVTLYRNRKDDSADKELILRQLDEYLSQL